MQLINNNPYSESMSQKPANFGIADQCLPQQTKEEADFMKQFDDDAASGKFGAALLGHDQYLRLQCLHVAEKQVGIMANEVLDYARKYYDFVQGK